MKITIDLKTDNAAFQENEKETTEIIERVADRVFHGFREGNLMDHNGNTVGKFKVTGK